jgi:hypothetical protein
VHEAVRASGKATISAWLVTLALAGFLAVAAPVLAMDKERYQVRVAPSLPGEAPWDTEQRIQSLLRTATCGAEPSFLGHLSLQLADEHYQPGEGMGLSVVAKAEWLRRASARMEGHAAAGDAICHVQYTFWLNPNEPGDAAHAGVGLLDAGTNPYARFGPDCASATTTVTVDNNFARAESRIPEACIRRQVNVAIAEWRNNRQPGSEHVPCEFGLGGSTEADFDVVIRDLTRVFFIDRAAGGSLLDSSTRDRLRDQLMSLSGPPMQDESYSLFECGNTEKSQGTPEEIAAEQGSQPMQEDLVDDLWPGIEWLLWRILLVLLAAMVIGALATALVALGGKAALLTGVLIGAGTAAVAVVSYGRIPETENHMLMIESSRYLKNQVLIEYYHEHGMAADAAEFEGHQAKLRAWLLERMQDVMEEEFEEYNSRPYQRYSLSALMNLHDYAEDPAMSLRVASQMVLDRQLAKYVVSSSQGRRYAPFRRQLDRLQKTHDKLEDDANPDFDHHGGHVSDLTDSDFPASMAQLYFGSQEQLVDGKVNVDSLGNLVHPAVTTYRPPGMLLDLATSPGGGLGADGTDGIWQHTFRHDGFERYARGRHFLLSAGGMDTGFANQLEILGVPFPTAGRAEDRGAAFPTTLVIDGAKQTPQGRVPRDQLQALLRIHGEKVERGDFYTYDQNLCVWKGFACGRDIRMPSSMWQCAVSGPQVNGAKWWFVDTGACPGYAPEHRVFIVIVASAAAPVEASPGLGVALGDGFFEAIDATDAGGDFQAFQSASLARNPNIGYARGSYASARNESIGWDFAFTGIRTINGVQVVEPEDWKRGVEGNVMSQPAVGRVDIENQRLGRRLVLDFFSPISPIRQEQ